MENDPASEVETRILPARRARSIPAGHVLDSAAVCKALKDGLGIEYFYLHQALALELLRTNVDVALSTSTASGKSLVYMVHIMRLLVNEARKKEKERGRILVVFPLKALAQDQLLKIRDAVKELWRGTSKTAKKMVDVAPIQVDVFDGDTDKKDRDRIRKTSSVILTNPDMLHLILAQHSMWAGFLSRLRFVVVDESHIYKGMFGTHFAFVLRRLRHVCATYGLIPNFLLLSGTISNPRAHAERLIGRPVELVSREFDGAPLGKRTFVIWNPALHQRRDGEPMKRKTLPEAASILCYLLEHTNLRGICFVKSRVVGEVLHKLVLETLRSRGPRAEALEGSVQNYRAGYKAEERRKTERMLFANQLRVVIATSALELGIDVGGLDFTVMLGFPGSVSSMWQQVGRSGRRTKPSLAILVATEVTADQYYASEPDMLLEAPAEFATLDLANQNIARNHLLCLIAETTLSNQVANDLFGEHVQNLLVELEQEGLVSALKMSAVHTQWQPVESKHATENSLGRHAFSFGLRSSSRETYTVVERGSEEIIEEVDAARAASVCHKGAVLLHQRESYLIISVDHATRRAVAIKPQVIRYYTEPKLETSVLGLHATAEVWIGGRGSGGLLRFGTVSIAETTTHFYKMKHFVSSGTESWGFDSKLHAVDFPAHQFETKATWLGFPMSLVTEFYARASSDFENAVEGLTHLLHSVIPWVAGCDTSEIKACTVGMSGMTDGAAGLPAEPSVKATATGSRGGVSNLFDRCVLIYDACSGGSGLAHTLFMTSSATLSVARDVLLRCACGPSRCPACCHACRARRSPQTSAARSVCSSLCSSART
ncbi:putative ATP-dependent helicase YprA [Porphyridium purpureum]|uniref:Putative ATP-dependent helicase YprA n=1 Tax=Porphyridium purpureum TaxID=35688 RepID=A0A5J4YG13_PORPP|nr:putative ATP-dependent helicase YprA [Porphyridium purpureum]|eukprot:POR0129..scf257_31